MSDVYDLIVIGGLPGSFELIICCRGILYDALLERVRVRAPAEGERQAEQDREN